MLWQKIVVMGQICLGTCNMTVISFWNHCVFWSIIIWLNLIFLVTKHLVWLSV